jgi:hypothetical protein
MKKTVINVAVIITLLFTQSTCAILNTQKTENADFSISIFQDGEEKKIRRNLVSLQKREFAIHVHFSESIVLFVSAALNDKTYKPAKKGKRNEDLPAFQSTGLAEGIFNEDRHITLADDAPNHWHYRGVQDHRFNNIIITGNEMTAVRDVAVFYDRSTRNFINISDVNEPLYLVFVEISEQGEIVTHRQYIKIQWQ